MSILVFVEQRDGQVRGVSREALGEAGADRALLAAHPAFANYDPAGYTRAVAAAAQQLKPAAVLFAASTMGRDLAPRVAARLGAGLATECTALAVEGGRLVAARPVFAGKALQRVGFPPAPALASLRPKAFEAVARPGRTAAVEPLAVDFDEAAPRARVLRMTAAAAGKVDLTEAEVIVSGGRGLRGPEHFPVVEALAEALGASVGASRPVVDAGWRPHAEQVGQTGKTVSPRLYVAVGISGAIQHLAGMMSSRCIVAINKDPEAPIFKVADYGIVGDLFEVVPALTEAVKGIQRRA